MSHRTPTLTGKSVIYFAAVLAVITSVLAPIPGYAQSASEVYKKMASLYSNAKSYQGTIVRVQTGKAPDGEPAVQTVTLKIQFKAPNRYFVNNLTSVSIGSKRQSSDQTMVCDGKKLYIFSSEQKLYHRGQIPNENMLSNFFALLTAANGFRLLPETTVNGRTAFVIKPNLPLKATLTQLANAKKVKITVMIDKQNFQFLKIAFESASSNLTQSVSGQVVNGSISDSVFVWTPPAGYKEEKAQTGPTSGPVVPR
jgi:outer membrane lipoprotein-sorting protein